jgi:membrane protease YdiL (CAAX protease family)
MERNAAMPRWVLGLIVVSLLTASLHGGRIGDVVEVAKSSFVIVLFTMAMWLVLGFQRSRSAL